jgi:putative ABC transport system ATP-binding protein
VSGARVEVRDLTLRFAGDDPTETITALDDLSIAIGSGESVGIVGQSGSGKTSLLNMIGAMDRPTSGVVEVDGVDVTNLTSRQRVLYRRRIGYVFQQFYLLPGLGALENVAAPLAPYTKARTARTVARRRLDQVGMSGRERSRPGQLSGGQQQRVAIARALVQDPVLVLADEPTGNLDRKTGAHVVDILLSLCNERATTLLFVTHDPEIAARCDRVVELANGRMVEPGSALEDALG